MKRSGQVNSVKEQMIKLAEDYVQNQFVGEATGHDWFHVDRVRKNALNIWRQGNSGNPFIIEMAALLHDVSDEKLNETAEKGRAKLAAFLQAAGLEAKAIAQIKEIIESISFKGGNNQVLTSIEAEIVQDADRLDAIGAVGIARVFAYGGKKGQPIYDPALIVREEMSVEEYRSGKSSSIHHFYEKLLKLKDMLNTNAAKKIAENRHRVMETFLEEFYKEWNGQS